MRFLTARKRAEGQGAAGTGTEHHWSMTVTAVGLALATPLFVFLFGGALGGSHAEVIATFSRPLPAILTALFLVVGLHHFQKGAQILIEDYARGFTRKALIVAVIVFSYSLIAAGLFALAKIAL